MEADGKAEKSREGTPTLEMHGVKQLPENTNCLACSEDGRYLCVGHSRGLSVWCASSLTCLSEWLEDRMEITSIQMTRIAETTYLLATVDDMGVARVFAHHCDTIHLLSVINIMEDIDERSICLTFELYEGGRYGAASFSCNDAVWLDIYHFPSAAWLEELERASSQKQDPNSSGDVKWSPVAVIIKIKPSKILADGLPEASKTTDFVTHCLALDAIMSSNRQWQKSPFNAETGKTTKTNESPRRCTQHFLLPCGQFPGSSEANFQPAGLPVAVAVWWSGSQNLLQYLLQKAPKNKADVEPKPDVLWPNAKEILCSAVSRCTRYIALGLDDALVCVWDRVSGAPLSVVTVPVENSAVIRMQFVDCWSVSPDDSKAFAAGKVHLLLLCKSGEIHTVTTGRGAQSCTMQLTERSKDNRELPSVFMPVPFLQGLSLVVQRNGKVSLQDVINKTTVCFLSPPTTHLVTTPCSPVFALNNKQQTLFLRGDQDTSYSVTSEDSDQSQLFIFPFGECDIIKQYVVSHPESPRQQKALSLVTLRENCDAYLQQRALSVAERNKDMIKTWERLQETAVKIQQRQ